MPRPRKPTNVLQLSGAFKANPSRGRSRSSEPAVAGSVGEPPPHLLPEAAACWKEIVALAHANTLGQADRLVVEYASNLLAQLRELNWVAPAALLARWEAVLGRLGLTPSDRSKVSALNAEARANPNDEFFQ